MKKYVLISSISDDKSTSDVIEWLNFYNVPFIRINEQDEIILSEYYFNNDNLHFELIIKNRKKIIKSNEIIAYWYRRGDISGQVTIKKSINNFDKKIIDLLNYENSFLFNSIHFLLSKIVKKSINSKSDNYTNKIINLLLAKEIGLNIPETLITTQKKKTSKIISDKIIKSIGFNEINFDNKILMQQKTEIYDQNFVNDSFFPTLFQNKINKVFEIRSFFLNDEFYSTAIFSQKDKKTEIDFRNYNYDTPNRTPPYNLPKNIKNKLIKLMNKLEMKSGSIDLIYTDEDKFIFLEINPIGQFMQVSIPGNYYLEKKIAEYLIAE